MLKKIDEKFYMYIFTIYVFIKFREEPIFRVVYVKE
jgi:hypothetical protein